MERNDRSAAVEGGRARLAADVCTTDEIGATVRSYRTTPARKGTVTMKLTTVTNVSLDGVTQGHRRIDAGTRREAGVPDEEGSGGFERFGWAPPLLDDEASTFISQAFQRADAFLFGRRTYEIFAGSWGAGMDPGNPVGGALNSRPKYVASTTLTDPQWAYTTVLSGDIAAAIGELRAEPGGELQVWGSGTLIRWLLDHRLVDEVVLLT